MITTEEALSLLKKHVHAMVPQNTSFDFYIKPNIPAKKLKNAIAEYGENIQEDDVIGLLDGTFWGSGKEGVIFTSYKLANKPMTFPPLTIWYDEIYSIEAVKHPEFNHIDKLVITLQNGAVKEFFEESFNLGAVMAFIVDIIELDNEKNGYQLDTERQEAMDLENNEKIDASHLAGYAGSINENMKNLADQERILGDTGHGVAAERANNFVDKALLKDAQVVGDDNAKNGPDRIVNGQAIQSKYFQNGRAAVRACFDENGQFRYLNMDGSPMIIEVPRDDAIYEAAIKAMKERILEGQVPGVTDPEKAYDLVKRGWFTYQQAVNIAKAGTVESIIFDSLTGAVTSVFSGGISGALAFASNIWAGDSIDEALGKSVQVSFYIGGVNFLTSVWGSQLQKSAFYKDVIMNGNIINLKGLSETIVDFIGYKNAAAFVNAVRGGNALHGAAAGKAAEKLMRGNMVATALMAGVLSINDIGQMFTGRISAGQAFKNATNTTAGLSGGAVGASVGATIGSVVPVVGTFIGGLLGGIYFGNKAAEVSNAVTSIFIEDDANQMVKIIEEKFKVLADEYLLGKYEVEKVVDRLKDELTGDILKDMYESDDRYQFAKALLEPIIQTVVSMRRFIPIPDLNALGNKYYGQFDAE